MRKLFLAALCLIFCAVITPAQKGKADPDYYPIGYSGETWTGEVTAFDNKLRTLTLTPLEGKKDSTFVAVAPDAGYEWRRDARNFRVVEFAFDKKAKSQTFKYVGTGTGAAYSSPDAGAGIQKRDNPSDSNLIDDFSQFKNRQVTVYYTARERNTVDGKKEKYNDVWRIRIIAKK